MFSDQNVAARGWHSLPLGIILIAAMSLSIWALNLLPAIAGEPQAAFRGTLFMAWVLLIGLGSLGLMGIAVTVGAFRMITGRSSRATTIAMIFLLSLGVIFIGLALVEAIRKVIAESGFQGQ